MSNSGLRPAEMYQRPVKSAVLNSVTSEPGGGGGYAPVFARCGTHFLVVTAHVLKSFTTGSAYRSPQRIWRWRGGGAGG
jgi:hypothetical protein